MGSAMDECLRPFSRAIPGVAVLLAVLLLASPNGGAPAGDKFEKAQTTNASNANLAQARVLPAPPMERPAYREAVMDPVLGTIFTRVTDPGSLVMACRRDYCRHRYSSAQAWNADQTLLAISNGCN